MERAAAKRKLEKLVIHHKKFKSQDHAGLTATMEAITPQDLLELLNSKDHAGIVDRQNEAIFTNEELDLLLDRSDLRHKENKENMNRRPKKVKNEVFKVIDTEGIPSGVLTSVGNN